MERDTGFDLKVLMTADTVGGVWNYCMELCRSLSRVRFFLVTSGAPLKDDQKNELAALPNVKLYETAYKLEWMQAPWDDIDASGRWMLQLEQTLRPDLIHLNSFSYAALPFSAPKIVVAHSDVYSWWHAVKGGRPSAGWETYYERVMAGLQGADCIVGISKASLDTMMTLYDVKAKTRIIYNGRKLAQATPVFEKQGVMAMGRLWDEAKNIGLLLEAAPHIQSAVKIAGDTTFEHNNTHLQKGAVRLLGRLNEKEIIQELSAAAVFVLPARYEPFGLSPLEAALCGCALVLGDVPTLREIWQDAALFVDPNSATELASVVNELIGNPKLLAAMTAKASARATQFSMDKMATAYLELYRKLSTLKV